MCNARYVHAIPPRALVKYEEETAICFVIRTSSIFILNHNSRIRAPLTWFLPLFFAENLDIASEVENYLYISTLNLSRASVTRLSSKHLLAGLSCDKLPGSIFIISNFFLLSVGDCPLSLPLPFPLLYY